MVESLSRLLVVREWKHIMCFLLSAFRRSKHCDYANSSVFTCLKSKYIPFILSTQADNMNESENISFTVGELLKRVEILMSHELKKFSCELRIDIRVDENTQIKGEINNLVQVMNNLILWSFW